METVSLFGHRRIDNIRACEGDLVSVLEECFQKGGDFRFLFGRNGEFDELAASVIKRMGRKFGEERCELCLVIPYKVADLEYYEKYYDSIILPEDLFGLHPKFAITARNRWMIERSDLVIVYTQRSSGGAYTAKQYAEKIGKSVRALPIQGDG